MVPVLVVYDERFALYVPLCRKGATDKLPLSVEWSCSGHGAPHGIHARLSPMQDTPSQKSSSDDEISILLVEDNPGDIHLTKEAFKSAEQEIALQTVTNGDDAVEFLQQSSDSDLPDLVLLDLNLPGRDGCGVLEVIRNDPRFKPLPALMLTSSEADEDVTRSSDALANAYLTKPTDPAEFISLVDTFERFWVEQARLPPIPP